ncbi:MAG: molecular chaperone TorD family protein [Actinomycetota bacterium]
MVVLTPLSHETLVARGVAYALLAQVLGADPGPLSDGYTTAALREALRASGDHRALDRLSSASTIELPDTDELRRRWVRWFDQGRVAPYECSNTLPSAGGHTPRLADIAGFYRAFGMEVSGDRPDHVVAELEFASTVTLAEAEARANSSADDAAVCATAARAFIRDHLGLWLDVFADRVDAIDALRPWTPFAAAAAELVAADAADRNVVPARSLAVLPDDAGLLADDDDLLPHCGEDCAGPGFGD